MASSDKSPEPTAAFDGQQPSGEPMTMQQHILDKGTAMMQSRQMTQYVCTFALYSHDLSRQIETHHDVSRSDDSNGRLIASIVLFGAPALMVSLQGVVLGMVRSELVQKRDDKYNISTDAMKRWRLEFNEPEWINPQADYWKQHGKGFAIDVEQTEVKKIIAPFP